MFPFTYYIDCRGDLWVPCSCGCRGNGGNGDYGGEEITTAAARRERLDIRRDERLDSDLRRPYQSERICRASRAEERMLQRETAQDKAMEEILAAVKRLEALHETELEGLAPGA